MRLDEGNLINSFVRGSSKFSPAKTEEEEEEEESNLSQIISKDFLQDVNFIREYRDKSMRGKKSISITRSMIPQLT